MRNSFSSNDLPFALFSARFGASKDEKAYNSTMENANVLGRALVKSGQFWKACWDCRFILFDLYLRPRHLSFGYFCSEY